MSVTKPKGRRKARGTAPTREATRATRPTKTAVYRRTNGAANGKVTTDTTDMPTQPKCILKLKINRHTSSGRKIKPVRDPHSATEEEFDAYLRSSPTREIVTADNSSQPADSNSLLLETGLPSCTPHHISMQRPSTDYSPSSALSTYS